MDKAGLLHFRENTQTLEPNAPDDHMAGLAMQSVPAPAKPRPTPPARTHARTQVRTTHACTRARTRTLVGRTLRVLGGRSGRGRAVDGNGVRPVGSAEHVCHDFIGHNFVGHKLYRP